jgi:hypothetical protein
MNDGFHIGRGSGHFGCSCTGSKELNVAVKNVYYKLEGCTAVRPRRFRRCSGDRCKRACEALFERNCFSIGLLQLSLQHHNFILI